jgi:hypothetical protein
MWKTNSIRILRGLLFLVSGIIGTACTPGKTGTDDALLTLLIRPGGVSSISGGAPGGGDPVFPPITGADGTFLADTVTEATNINAGTFGDPAKAVNGIGGTFDVYSMRYERTAGPFSYCKDYTTVPAYSQLPVPSGAFAPTGAKDKRAAEQCLVLEWAGKRVTNRAGEDFRVYENGFEINPPGSGNFFMEPLIVEVSDNGTDWCGWNPQYIGLKETDPTYLLPDGRYKSNSPKLIETRKQANYLRFAGVQLGGNISNGDAFDLDDSEFGNSGSGPDGKSPCDVIARNRMRAQGFVYIRLVTAWSRDTVDYPLPYDSFDAASDVDAVYAWSVADR